MTRLKLIGLVLNKRQLVLYKTTKLNERIVPFVVEKNNTMKFKNSVVRQNVTRDLSICSEHSSLIPSQIATKLWSFYPLIVLNYWLKYQSQKFCLSWERGKISSICHARFFFRKLSREIAMHVVTPYIRLKQIICIPLSIVFKGVSTVIQINPSLCLTG